MKLPAAIAAAPDLARLLQLAVRAGCRLYLVGGAVRDLAAGELPVDLDLAVAGGAAMPLAAEFARAARGAFVPLDPEFDTARVVARGVTWDLAGLRGPDIETDLARRDFTVNAMAVELAPGRLGDDLAILDPTGGLEDWHGRRLRLAGPGSLADDPVRVLRAYRFAAQLELALDETVRAAGRPQLERLAAAAGERLAAEWWKLAAGLDFPRALRLAEEDGVLAAVFAPASFDTTGLLALEAELAAPAGRLPEELRSALRVTYRVPHRRGLGRTGLLLTADPAAPAGVQARLRLARQQERSLAVIGQAVGLAGRLMAADRWSAAELLALFEPAADWAPLAIAGAAIGAARDGPERAAALWQDYRLRVAPALESPPLVSGGDVVACLGQGGPRVGEILRRIAEARIAGRVATREEALELVCRCAAEEPPADPPS